MQKRIVFLVVNFGAAPLILSIFTFFLMTSSIQEVFIAALSAMIIGGLLVGLMTGKRTLKPDNAMGMMTLSLLPPAYTAVLWALFMLISGGFYGANSWLFYSIGHIALAPLYFLAMFEGEGRLFLWAPLGYELSFLAGMFLFIFLKRNHQAYSFKKALPLLIVFALAIGTGSAVQWNRSKTVLPSYGFKYGGGFSSTDLMPYEVVNEDNVLPKLQEESAFMISDPDDMPILDGAEAAFPVYSAFANAAYKDIASVAREGREIITFTNTIHAYERLLTREVDIYFGAEPSKEQLEMAKSSGNELVMTPIGKEAFVFFVNESNPMDNLSISEIQGIYSGKIKNWSQLGGGSERIIAFQRPKNSGSQTLLEKIMGDTPIMKPLREDVPEGMGGIIEQVADYRNYHNSIGFSFRFFATGMNPNADIKLLAIDGIEPSPENIASGKYPFTANLYAITLKDNPKPAVQPFLDWMQGPQGQELVEKIGYIRMDQ